MWTQKYSLIRYNIGFTYFTKCWNTNFKTSKLQDGSFFKRSLRVNSLQLLSCIPEEEYDAPTQKEKRYIL